MDSEMTKWTLVLRSLARALNLLELQTHARFDSP